MGTWGRRGEAGERPVPGPGRRRRAAIASAAAAAVLVAGGVAAAVTVTRAHGANVAGLSSTFSRPGSSPSVTAAANVTPPVAAGRKAPAAARGTMPAAPGSSGPGSSGPGRPTAPATAPSSPAGTSGLTPAGSSSGLSIGTSSLVRAASEGASYASSVIVSGGNGHYAWSATGLPPGLTAHPDGSTLHISGVPTAAGTFNAILSVTDSASPAHSATDSDLVYVTLPPVRATVNAPATAYVGQPYSGTVTATGGDGTYNWSSTFLAPGLTATAHGATLAISGAPVVGGEPVLSGTVSDGESPAQIYNWVIPLTVSQPPITISGSTPAATVGRPYQAKVTASGGDGSAYTWSYTSLPPGLTAAADGATLTISGTPTAPGTYPVEVTVTDTVKEQFQPLTIVVSAAS